MDWLFWTVLIIGIVLFVWPFLALASAAAAVTMWTIGLVLILGAVIWAIVGGWRRSISSLRAEHAT